MFGFLKMSGSTQTTQKDSPPQVNIQNDEIICQRMNHNEPIVMIVVDDNVPQYDKLLCGKCVEEQRSVYKLIGLKQAREMIRDKYIQFNTKNEEIKKYQLGNLQNLLQQVSQLKMEITQNLDQILSVTEHWMNQIQNFGNVNELDLIQELIDLNPAKLINYEEQKKYLEISKSHLHKISLVFKQLCSQDRYKNVYASLKNIYNTLQIKEGSTKKFSNVVKEIQQVYSVGQCEESCAMALNKQGTIMVAGCDKDIKVWQFENGTLTEQRRLQGHYQNIQCIVFSQTTNWFVSGSLDNQIRCWKEQSNQDWISSWPGKSHSLAILCIILTKNEDELLSCSYDKSIKVWQVSSLKNSIKFDYSLQDKHTESVNCICLNDSETALVSCSDDKALILWVKGYNNKKWVFQNEIRMQDYGYRHCFINNNVIAWQQQETGLTHILYLKNGELIHSLQQKCELNTSFSDTTRLFPNQVCVKREIIVQKHAKQVFVLKFEENNQLKIVGKPIECGSESNFGTLSYDGSYIVIWNNLTKQFKVYEIIYEEQQL